MDDGKDFKIAVIKIKYVLFKNFKTNHRIQKRLNFNLFMI